MCMRAYRRWQRKVKENNGYDDDYDDYDDRNGFLLCMLMMFGEPFR